MRDQTRGARDEHDAAHAGRRYPDVDERGTGRAGTVDRKVTPGDLVVHRTDEREQSEMRAEEPFRGRELVDARRAGVDVLVHRVPEPGIPARPPRGA